MEKLEVGSIVEVLPNDQCEFVVGYHGIIIKCNPVNATVLFFKVPDVVREQLHNGGLPFSSNPERNCYHIMYRDLKIIEEGA